MKSDHRLLALSANSILVYSLIYHAEDRKLKDESFSKLETKQNFSYQEERRNFAPFKILLGLISYHVIILKFVFISEFDYSEVKK